MEDIDLENLGLLKKAAGLLLHRACDELIGEQPKSASKSEAGQSSQSKPFTIFGRAAPIQTLEGAGRLIMILSQVQSTTASASEPLVLSAEDEQWITALAEHARAREIEQARLKQLSTPK